jgi:plastocyanin
MRRPFVVLLVAAALGLAACGGSDDSSAGNAEADPGASGGKATATDAVTIESFEFKPQQITVASGTTVTWTNGDSAVHSIKDKGDLFESDDLSEGGTFEHTYDEAGEFPYICGIHQYMTGTVVVEG